MWGGEAQGLGDFTRKWVVAMAIEQLNESIHWIESTKVRGSPIPISPNSAFLRG
jgi:hypothetical protein